MSRKSAFLSLCTLLSGCTSITIPDVRLCTIAGQMSAGMDCARSLSDGTESLDFDASLEFLEPNLTRGGAMCLSTADFSRLKTSLEQACEKLGRACNREVKEKIQSVTYRVDSLEARAIAKRKIRK